MSAETSFRARYFKLYGSPAGLMPEPQIRIYYYGIPLFFAAIFEGDRYSFALPLNLSTKMDTGDLLAEFSFKLEDSPVRSSPIPISLLITDRYD